MGLVRVVAKIFQPKWAFLAIAAVGAWEAYVLLKPKPPALDEPRRKAAEQACWQAVEKLPRLPAADKVAVLPLAGDKGTFVTDMLRATLERTATYTQPETPLLQRVMRELQIDARPVTSLPEAVAAGRRLNVPYVLFGGVSDFTSDLQTGRINLKVTLVSVADANAVVPPVVAGVPEPDEPGRGFAATLWAFAWRAMVWLAGVALLPLVTHGLIRRVLNVESNAATFFGLLAYGLAAWMLAFALSGFAIAGWLAALLLLAALVAAMVYDYHVFSAIEGKRR